MAKYKIETNSEVKYTYNDVAIKPSTTSSIRHRSECNVYDGNGNLPLFTAPMDTVVDENNYQKFIDNKITPIIPRTVSIEKRIELLKQGIWAAFSLNEFETYFTGDNHLEIPVNDIKYHALIDVANGHMMALYDTVQLANAIYNDRINTMLGNIANPETYRVAYECHVDYIRVGIGGGQGCITSSNTSVHYPMASLIADIYNIRQELRESGVCGCRLPKIVADGGVRNYPDAIRALALGSDYVMIGSVFARMLESAASKTSDSSEYMLITGMGGDINSLTNVHKDDDGWHGTFNGKEFSLGEIYARFYGMASRAGQIALNGKKTRTVEGIEKKLTVDYTMNQWCENFRDYLQSAMSYTDSHDLNEFRQNTKLIVMSNNTYNSINK